MVETVKEKAYIFCLASLSPQSRDLSIAASRVLCTTLLKQFVLNISRPIFKIYLFSRKGLF